MYCKNTDFHICGVHLHFPGQFPSKLLGGVVLFGGLGQKLQGYVVVVKLYKDFCLEFDKKFNLERFIENKEIIY